MNSFSRKFKQFASDPVLRRWLAGRLIGLRPGAPAFQAHNPPYLAGLLPLAAEHPSASFGECDCTPPGGPIELPLPGYALTLHPGDEQGLFRRQFDDTETLLGLHRFAWLPLIGDKLDARWVAALWRAWLKDCATPGDQWSWHPYTTAERLVNILDFASRHGLPGPADETLAALAGHAPAIAKRLEYFGEHHTSNHLANNGRGLFLLGLALSLDKCADLGTRILIEEARRIFHPASGMLREGSSHYHLLLTRNYAEAWLAAIRHDRPETEVLEQILSRALSAAACLLLPGGFPAIGDISPDCPPDFLFGLIPGSGEAGGWLGRLQPDARREMKNLLDQNPPADDRDLTADGWLRAKFGPWAGLWQAAPDGWSAMPGHGHQDLGGFEIHFAGEPLFIDLGRGQYGEDPAGRLYCQAVMHNTLLIDEQDPYPPNRPYYDQAFRRSVVLPPPQLSLAENQVSLTHHGFSRFGNCAAVERNWRFHDQGFSLSDKVGGTGRRRIQRQFLTTLKTEQRTGGVVLKGAAHSFALSADAPISVEPATFWRAYGEGRPASRISLETVADLPWESTLKLELI